MPMELLFTLAQSNLPMTIEDPTDIDKLRVIAAAQLVDARLPDVGAREQTAQVLSISAQGRAALAKAFPQHQFQFSALSSARSSPDVEWGPSRGSYRVERASSRSTLDS